MAAKFHAGEIAMQLRAGVSESAARVGGSIREEMPAAAQAFLEQRRFVIVATADPAGRPWASLLTGPAGFASAPDPRTVRIHAVPLPGDPLAENLETAELIGLLAIDLASRRRMRVNGRLSRTPDGAIEVAIDQVYSNCPKYIQRRVTQEGAAESARGLVARASTLAAVQRDRIRRADTFFIATLNPAHGADASHRGGMPGFVAVEGDRLVWPDYAGNLMFNTLGNIVAHPRARLLFPDFQLGSSLQLTGRAAIDWAASRMASIPGAERLVELEVEEVVDIRGALPPMAGAPDYSPFNPPAGS